MHDDRTSESYTILCSRGRRISKTVNGAKTRYFYIGDTVVGEESAANGKIAYIYDDAGRISALRRTINGTTTTYHILTNSRGDVEAIYRNDGTLIARYIYDAYGNEIKREYGESESHRGIASINPFRYRGYMYDSETGYYYLMSRYYNPTIGRFVSVDTTDILFEDDDNVLKYNLYAYCYNNPVNMNDDSGESPSNAIGAIIGGLAGYALGAFLGPYVTKYGKKVSSIIKSFGKKSTNNYITQAFFTKGTLVLTKDGNKSIEEIKVGELVYSENIETGEIGLKQVLQTFVNQADELIHIYVENDEIISTPEHPFYVPKKG